MTICSPSTGNITLGLRPQAILPASGEQPVMLSSHKGNNCILVSLLQNVVKSLLSAGGPHNFFTISI